MTAEQRGSDLIPVFWIYCIVQAVFLAIAAPANIMVVYGWGEPFQLVSWLPAMVFFGGMLTCIPIFLFCVFIRGAVSFGTKRDWSRGMVYMLTISLAVAVFWAAVSILPYPIPKFALHIKTHPIERPLLDPTELPLLVATVVAAFVGTWFVFYKREVNRGTAMAMSDGQV